MVPPQCLWHDTVALISTLSVTVSLVDVAVACGHTVMGVYGTGPVINQISGPSCFFLLFPAVSVALDLRGWLGWKVGSACEEFEDNEDLWYIGLMFLRVLLLTHLREFWYWLTWESSATDSPERVLVLTHLREFCYWLTWESSATDSPVFGRQNWHHWWHWLCA